MADPRAEVFANWGPAYREVADSSSEFDHVLESALVEIHLSCKGLLNTDSTSKTDPLAILTETRYRRALKKQDRLLGLTEQIQNQLNPEFAKGFFTRVRKFDMDGHLLKVGVFDVDKANSSSVDLGVHDLVGGAAVSMADLLRAPGMRVELRLQANFDPRTTVDGASGRVAGAANPSVVDRGSVVIQAQLVNETASHGVASWTMSASDLDKCDSGIGAKSDPFVIIRREASPDSRAFFAVYRSPVVLKSLSPVWGTISMPLCALCANDLDRMLSIEVYDWDDDGSTDFIGSAIVNVRGLLGQTDMALPLINQSKLNAAAAAKKKYENSGVLTLSRFSVRAVPGGAIPELPPPAPLGRIDLRAVESWSEADLARFLTVDKHMPEALGARIMDQGVDGPVLLSLSDAEVANDLVQAVHAQLTIGQRKKLQQIFAQLRQR